MYLAISKNDFLNLSRNILKKIQIVFQSDFAQFKNFNSGVIA